MPKIIFQPLMITNPPGRLTEDGHIRRYRKPIQGDQLQARNNKRKIKRCAKLIKAHQKGEISLWEEDEEQRKEILHLFSTFHSPFVEILESLKDEETEEEA